MANYEYIVSTGVIIPDTSDILTDVQNEYKDAFQDNALIVTADTPQGVLITAETLARDGVVRNNAALANQINPNIAGGEFLDAICALTGLARNKGTYSLVPDVVITGVPSTIVPEGSLAKTAAGDIFETLSTIVLPVTGTATVDFRSQELGPVPATIASLTQIVTPVLGWETVSNPIGATVGQLEQSDEALRALRRNTLALQGVALVEAITSGVYAVQGVKSLAFRENYFDTPVGMIVSVTGGTTLSGTVWGMTTPGEILVGTDDINFAESDQTLPVPNPWPIAAFTTTGNITLSGLGTQGNGDWSGTLTAGNIILVKDQTTDSQNGVYLAAAGAWTRQAYNPAASTIYGSSDGISMVAYSIFLSVYGGSDLDVAAAILNNKSLGANYNGNTTVNVVEPSSGQTYPVKFQRPTEIPILIRLTITANDSIIDPVNTVKDAILAYADGELEGEAGFVVGGSVSAFELAGAINRAAPGIFVKVLEITKASSVVWSSAEIPIGLDQVPVTQSSSITVTI